MLTEDEPPSASLRQPPGPPDCHPAGADSQALNIAQEEAVVLAKAAECLPPRAK